MDPDVCISRYALVEARVCPAHTEYSILASCFGVYMWILIYDVASKVDSCYISGTTEQDMHCTAQLMLSHHFEPSANLGSGALPCFGRSYVWKNHPQPLLQQDRDHNANTASGQSQGPCNALLPN